MKKFIKGYQNPNILPLNEALINHYYDNDLVPYIVDAFKSLEVLPYIKILGYKFEPDESKIDMNEFIRTRNNSKSQKQLQTSYMYVQESRNAQITMKIELTLNGESKIIYKKLLIPKSDKDGYYLIKGKRYSLLYQLVDASTYTTRENLVYKSLTGVSIGRQSETLESTDGEVYKVPAFVIYMFGKPMNILLLYFASMGVSKTLRYFSVDKIISFSDNCEDEPEKYIYFMISKKIYIKVNRYFFKNYTYVQSIVKMIDLITTNRLTFDDLDNKNFWVEKIGSRSVTNPYNYYDKGKTTLLYFDRLLDETSKKILKVHGNNKNNIYAVVRWLVQNFNELRKKDNMSLINKRLRDAECLGSLLTKAFSERVNRIIRLGKKVDMEQLEGMFNFNGDIIITELQTSGLLRYDERINDQDLWNKLKWTTKGPNSLGGKNDKNISIKYRGIHPSYIGKIDLNVCGNSDPGTTGVLTPMCKTHGLYFSEVEEPEDFSYEFNKKQHEIFNDADADGFIDISRLGMNEYYDTLQKMSDIIDSCQVTRKIYKEDEE